ncbi:MAG: hypothetical protein FWG72_09020 [Oscillospiraceae bacterium]|nr:hypothetical protein [Oscillospiraceae bacterium]
MQGSGGADKDALELPMCGRAYDECSHPSDFRAYTEGAADYIGFRRDGRRHWVKCADGGKWEYRAHIVYPLKGAATKLTGQIAAPKQEGDFTAGLTATYAFSDEAGALLFESPVMSAASGPVGFAIDVSGCLSVRVSLLLELASPGWYGHTGLIQNMRVTTTDY